MTVPIDSIWSPVLVATMLKRNLLEPEVDHVVFEAIKVGVHRQIPDGFITGAVSFATGREERR